MKFFLFTLMTIAALPLSLRAQGFLHLTNGQSFSYTFTSLTFIQSQALVLQGGGVSFYRLAQPGPSDEILVELFENSLTESPVASRILTGQVGDGFGQSLIWQDLQGAVRLTVLSGSMDLTGLRFTAATGPPDFNYYQSFVAVPEPNNVGLLIGGCIFMRWVVGHGRKKRHRHDHAAS